MVPSLRKPLGRVLEVQYRRGGKGAARATARRYLKLYPHGAHARLGSKRRRPMKRAAARLGVALLLGGQVGFAQGPAEPSSPRSALVREVVLVAAQGGEFVARVEAELAGLGFRVQLQPQPPQVLSATTIAIVVAGDSRVDVWLVKGANRHRELHASLPRERSDSDSIRVAERLRGLFQQIPTLPVPPPPRGEGTLPAAPPPRPGRDLVPANDPVIDRAAPARQSSAATSSGGPTADAGFVELSVEAGAAALSQPGGPALSLSVGAHVGIAPWLSLGALSALPLTGRRSKRSRDGLPLWR